MHNFNYSSFYNSELSENTWKNLIKKIKKDFFPSVILWNFNFKQILFKTKFKKHLVLTFTSHPDLDGGSGDHFTNPNNRMCCFHESYISQNSLHLWN